MSRALSVPRPERLGRRQFSWGLVDQVISSATNFSLAVVGGRLVGASGLGVVYLGFTVCLLVQAMQRALITEPLVVTSAAMSPVPRRVVTANALTVALSYALTLTAVMVALGLTLPAPYGRAILIFAPWLSGVLLQDLWRTLLFRDGRGAAAALNDGVWALAMAATLPVAIVWPSEWTVALVWGIGATAGAILGFVQTGLRPASAAVALRWWRRSGLPLGRWLGAEALVLIVQAQLTVIILTAALGTAAMGGLRSVQAVFAPMSLLAQALSFPGLPLLTRWSAVSRGRARWGATLISGVATSLVLAYLALVVALRTQLLDVVFGAGFVAFAVLAVPVGVQQLALAAAQGFSVLARAEGRGRILLVSRAIGAVATVALVVAIAPTHGLVAAVWAVTAGLSLASAATIVLALWHPRDRPSRS